MVDHWGKQSTIIDHHDSLMFWVLVVGTEGYSNVEQQISLQQTSDQLDQLTQQGFETIPEHIMTVIIQQV